MSLLGINQVLYLTKVQYVCTSKIDKGEELNLYETLSALETHSMLWLLGWIVEPNTAQICFAKQFHLKNLHWLFPIPQDSKTKDVKKRLLKGEMKSVRLAWKSYNSKASILLNGSTMSITRIKGATFFSYHIPSDYKVGVVKIAGIKLSETFLIISKIKAFFLNIHISEMKKNNVTNLYYLTNMKNIILAVMTILITSCGGYKTERARPVDSVVASILKNKMQEYDATSGIVIIKSVGTDNVIACVGDTTISYKSDLAKTLIKEKGKVKPMQILTFVNDVAKRSDEDSLKKSMRQFVTHGLGKKANPEYIWVAGMAGTTEQKDGTYWADFCGFYTQYTIMVAIQRKDIPVSGGAMAGSIFKEVVEYIANKADYN